MTTATYSGTIATGAAYCTVAELKTYLGITGAGDDTLLAALIARAQAAIEKKTRRRFICAADTTRRFTVGQDTEGLNLWFDDDLCQFAPANAVVNDADGTATALVLNTDFITIPRNETPYLGIRLLSSAVVSWDYTSNAETGISVAGRWAYSVTPPDDIVQACVRWAAYMYKQKDASTFDTTAMPDAGVMMIPQGIPKDVEMLITPYIMAAL